MTTLSNLDGRLAIFLSAFAFALFNVLMKLNFKKLQLHPMQTMALITAPQSISLLYMHIQKLCSKARDAMKPNGTKSKDKAIFVLIIALLVICLFAHLLSLKTLPASDITALYSLRSFLVAPFAYILLNENVGRFYPALLLLSLSGMILIVKPPFLFEGSSPDYVGLFSVAVHVLAQSAYVLLSRIIKPDSTILVTVVRVTDSSIAIFYCIYQSSWTSLSMYYYGWAAIASACHFSGLFFRMIGINRLESGIVTLLMNSQIAFTCILEFLIIPAKLQDATDWNKWAGIFCLFAASSYYAYSLVQPNKIKFKQVPQADVELSEFAKEEIL